MRKERLVENNTRNRALRELGVPSIPIKLKAGVDTGWNDVLFLIPGGRPLFIEFKDATNTKGVEKKQCYKHTLLEELGYDTIVCFSVIAALYHIAEKVVAASVPEKGRKISAGARRGGAISGPRPWQDKYYARCVHLLEEARHSV